MKTARNNNMEQLCPRQCGRPARKHPLYGILPCFTCIGEDREKRKATRAPEFYSQTMQTRVQEQRDKFEKDLMSPYNPDGTPSEEYRRANPEKAKELFQEFERVTGQTTELAR